MRAGYSDSLCVECDNDVCKVYGGRCGKYRLLKFFRTLFCKHSYTKIAWREEYDVNRNERYPERLYECNKCGKKIWIDGRYDYF